jgi:hypothetical protein
MKRSPISPIFVFTIVALAAALFLSSLSASAQRRDYMTEEEIEQVRNNQDIDLRIAVLVRMIDRRFNVLGIEVNGWKERDRDAGRWGQPPTGTRLQLISDIRQLLDKAIDDLDVIVQRNEDALTQNKTTGRLFPKAVKTLEAAARRYLPMLIDEAAKAADERERGQLLNSAELCEQIIEAAGNLALGVR